MVVVDIQIAVTPDGQVEQAVGGEGSEHVVEEADAGVDGGVAVAVDSDRHLDIRLAGGAGDRRRSLAHTRRSAGVGMTVVVVGSSSG